MRNTLVLFVSAFAGAGVGLVHFYAIWFSIRNLENDKKPMILFVFGFFLRTAVSAGAFGAILYFSNFWGLAAALASFIAVRTIIVRRIGRSVALKGNQ